MILGSESDGRGEQVEQSVSIIDEADFYTLGRR